MRLLYVYFDFTKVYKDGYRGYKTCGFNVGTEQYFETIPPTMESDGYILKATDRLAGDKIASGFWGNTRIYNISALVGDNGAGKTTIIHEILCCLGGKLTEGIEYILLMQEHSQKYHLYTSFPKVDTVGFVQPLTSEGNYTVKKKLKLAYFSNALTMSDLHLFDVFDRTYIENPQPNDRFNTHTLYNVSLTSDIIQAINTSNGGIGNLHGNLLTQLDTYFNFRSYQEARGVFDRMQRNILHTVSKKSQFHVRLPNELNLTITPSIVKLKECFHPTKQRNIEGFEAFCHTYYPPQLLWITELCWNCIAGLDQFTETYIQKALPVTIPEFNVLEWDVPKCKEYFLNLISVYKAARPHDADSQMELSEKTLMQANEYYTSCEKYIQFLWNNMESLKHFWTSPPNDVKEETGEYPSVRIRIPLLEPLDPVLHEFMIRFVNMTRSVSHEYYFVLYNWGLSSGESNMLQILTKLRYLLDGNTHDMDTKTEMVTKDNIMLQLDAERKESIKNGDILCDSLLLFIDEADLTLHPEWQRRFVSILTNYLPELFRSSYYTDAKKGCQDIQIILGTHSPIMLGDFPGSSVLYLKKDANGYVMVNDHNPLHTFGENIYALLNDGFYLEKGAIGELARQKIDDVLRDTSCIQGQIKNIRTHITLEKVQGWLNTLDRHYTNTVQYLPEGLIQNSLKQQLLKCLNRIEDIYHKALAPASEATAKDGACTLQEQIDTLYRKLETLQ